MTGHEKKIEPSPRVRVRSSNLNRCATSRGASRGGLGSCWAFEACRTDGGPGTEPGLTDRSQLLTGVSEGPWAYSCWKSIAWLEEPPGSLT